MVALNLEEKKKNILTLWRVICDLASLSGIFPGYSILKTINNPCSTVLLYPVPPKKIYVQSCQV